MKVVVVGAGNGAGAHLRALRELGPCPCHRRSFAPVAALCKGTLALPFAAEDEEALLPGGTQSRAGMRFRGPFPNPGSKRKKPRRYPAGP